MQRPPSRGKKGKKSTKCLCCKTNRGIKTSAKKGKPVPFSVFAENVNAVVKLILIPNFVKQTEIALRACGGTLIFSKTDKNHLNLPFFFGSSELQRSHWTVFLRESRGAEGDRTRQGESLGGW